MGGRARRGPRAEGGPIVEVRADGALRGSPVPRRAAGAGVALRDRRGVNDPDHLLFVDGRACGILEAKTVGRTLTGVEGHSKRYREPVPGGIPTWGLPLFAYESTGVEAR